MSTQAVTDFLQKVAEDQTLQTELVQALKADNDREAVTQLGNVRGYEFTSEELWAEIQARQAEIEQKRASGELELSDEELEAVSGGELFFVATMVAFGIASAVGSIVGTATAHLWGIDASIKW
ncbi:Nif11-like leader peptide family natural product precursor [Leptolyngbya sp. GGD]|uniref:Nif11-like leader peptide family natural product precursor n=1 Tax=Leptolyngbya sp. GGD TaxID=2997907 RepID=UPI00227D00BA|nr:Nif11-like leader peptide family natural product precursor [Leptolyngbya sp. GGD]MCY6490356.1 Nif11-like leader peptide family natural product precursor [Leptolyngbya sp. GGD]